SLSKAPAPRRRHSGLSQTCSWTSTSSEFRLSRVPPAMSHTAFRHAPGFVQRRWSCTEMPIWFRRGRAVLTSATHQADADKLAFATIKPRWYPLGWEFEGGTVWIATAASRSLSSEISVAADKPILRGIHHLALVTDNMQMTLDFYMRVLGMPIVHG